MAKNTYKSYDELPLMLLILVFAALFGIPIDHANDLVHEEVSP